MYEVTTLLVLLLLATAGYTAGRMHAQFSYRLGYRFGYRQGYFDGDRASWNRRRRELQAAVASVLKTRPRSGPRSSPSPRWAPRTPAPATTVHPSCLCGPGPWSTSWQI